VGRRAKKCTAGVRGLPEQCGQRSREVGIYRAIYKYCGYDQIRINKDNEREETESRLLRADDSSSPEGRKKEVPLVARLFGETILAACSC